MTKRKLNFCRIDDKDALAAAGVPWTTKRLREMRLRGENPQLFVKVGKFLMIDLDAFDATILEPALAERDKRTRHMQRASTPTDRRKRA